MTTTTTKPKKTPATPMARTPDEQLHDVLNGLSAHFAERDGHIDALMAAMLAEEHALLIGPPGVAKSALVRALANAVDDGTGGYFEILLTRYTGPDEVFGPVSLKALEQDSYRRMTRGRLPSVRVAFLDEVFKASSAILNTLLGALNERIFHDDGVAIDIPLEFVVGASNELPKDDDSLEAFADRFLVRLHVDRLSDDGARRALFNALPMTRKPIPRMERVVLAELRARVDNVGVSDAITESLVAIRTAIHAEGIAVSDRRWAKAVRYLRARRVLAGGLATVRATDLLHLADVLWTRPEQIPLVQELLQRHAAPWLARVHGVQKMIDEQSALVDEIAKAPGAMQIAKLGVALEALDAGSAALDAVGSEFPDAIDAVKDVRDRIKAVRSRVVQGFKSRGVM
jgi:MoxR-like ATPase